MTSGPSAKINLDIRDSVPDWTPYLPPKAPEGAPNVLYIAWDDLGYGTMDVVRRSGRDAEHAAHRRHGREVLELPHDGAVLADAFVAADRSQRDQQRHGHHRRVQLRLPRDLHSHPVRERVHLRGARRARLQHVLRREVAPHPGRGVQPRRVQGPLAARARVRALLRVPRRRGEPVVPRPRPGQQPDRCARDARRGLPPVEGPRRPGDRDDPSRQGRSTPTSRSSCTSRPGAGHAPHHVSTEWADKYKGKFDHGYEAIRAEILARQKELGLLPDDTELSPINPHGEPERTGPDGQPWPLLDTVRPWDSLSADEQRLFARMAEVFAGLISYTDDQLGRVLDYLEESGQLDNTLVVVVSDNGASGEGGPNGSFNEWRFFNGVADTTETTLPHIDELGTPAVVQPLQHRLGVGVRHAVPVLEALGGLRGRRRRHVHGRLARADRAAEARRATSTSTPSTSSRPSTTCSASSRPTVHQGLPAEPDRGRELRGRAHRPDGARASRRSSTRCSGSARSTTRAGSPAPCTRRSAGGASSSTTSGSSTTSSTTARSRRTSPTDEPERLETLKSLWFYYAGHLQRPAARRPHRARAGARRTPARRHRIASSTSYYPDCRRRARVGGGRDQRPVVHDRGGRRDRLRRRRGRAVRARWRRGRPQPLRQGQEAALHVQLARHQAATTSSPTATSPPARTSSPPSSRRRARATDPTMPGFAGTADALPRRRRRSARARSSPSPATSASSATASASGATAPHRSRPTTPRRSAFTGGTIDKVVVDVSGEKYVDHEAQVAAWFSID